MKTLAVTVAGLALAGVTGAKAQDYPVPYGVLYPYAGLYMAAPVGVAPAFAPYGGAYAPPLPNFQTGMPNFRALSARFS